MPNYIVQRDFVAPSKSKNAAGQYDYLTLKKGDFIAGKQTTISRGYQIEPVVQTDNGFLIPLGFVKKYTPDKSKVESLLNSKEAVASISAREYTSEIFSFSDDQLKIAGIGALVGFGYGLIKNKSLLWSSAGGALAGGLLSKVLAKVKKGKS